ncbi:hypothetical protein DID88_004925 [Monilinia fructigena]|uniref:Uncharacterized protein n=1 Tax=Monilinia fructigena TaxID=38457 RepID=A0A395IVI3_9HELO|nr:hypothetical protein DID88_004925 [Monilinia fructigena]
MDAMEYVGQHPTVCRKMFDLWPEYRVFQEYNLEAWKVIEEEAEEETKQKQPAAAAFAHEGMIVEHATATTRIIRSSNCTIVKNSSRRSSNQMKKRRRPRITKGKNHNEDEGDESENGDTDDAEEKESTVNKLVIAIKIYPLVSPHHYNLRLLIMMRPQIPMQMAPSISFPQRNSSPLSPPSQKSQREDNRRSGFFFYIIQIRA